MKKIIILLVVVAHSMSGFAQTVTSEATVKKLKGRSKGEAIGNNIAAQSTNGATTSNSNVDTLQQSSVNNLKNSQKGQSSAMIMQVGLMAAGTALISPCSTSGAACAAMAALFGMGMLAGKSAKSFNPVIDDSWQNTCTFSSYGCGGVTPNNPYPNSPNPNPNIQDPTPQIERDASKIQIALAEAGYSVDPNSGKVSSKDGSFNVNDPASMQNALGADGYSDLMNKVSGLEARAGELIKAVDDKMVNKALGLEDGSGGGMGNVAAVGGYEEGGAGGSNSTVSKINKLANMRNPAAKGLTKNFNGDPIGVSADSIFEMMNRRYQLKNSQKTFYGPDLQ